MGPLFSMLRFCPQFPSVILRIEVFQSSFLFSKKKTGKDILVMNYLSVGNSMNYPETKSLHLKTHAIPHISHFLQPINFFITLDIQSYLLMFAVLGIFGGSKYRTSAGVWMSRAMKNWRFHIWFGEEKNQKKIVHDQLEESSLHESIGLMSPAYRILEQWSKKLPFV